MASIKRKSPGSGARRNLVSQDMEQFHRNQEASFRKAINEEEVPVKMKHTRNLIIGTHTNRSGRVFWGLVSLSPPIHTDVTTWKFCHSLHLILRDGHPNFIRDSIQQIGRIRNMGEHFRHLPAGYGGLIQRYCALLIIKLSFHQHYPRFPGTLHVSPDELESIAENDANNYFEMAVEMLEYMEKILKLYEGVFESLDPSRANSMTKMGQCRLSPLIPCIQDSSCLYDFIVRILFKLHKIVPTDMLSGHRTRFNQQFKILHTFYGSTRNLQYFKTLIQVPHLPQVPPNFLIEAELGSHVAPVVVMEEEVPDPADAQESILVDTSEQSPPPVPPHPDPDVVNSHNGPLMKLMAERDALIDALQEELRDTRTTVQTLRSENSYVQEQLKLRINDLESNIAELDSELTAERQSKESVLAQVEAAAASAEAVGQLAEEETRRRMAEEKFTKMKEVYQKLRDEHITLIRTKAELDKSVTEERKSLLEERDRRMEKERDMQDLQARLQEESARLDEVLKEKESLETQGSTLSKEREETQLANSALQVALDQAREQLDLKEKQLLAELSSCQTDLTSRLEGCVQSAVESSVMSIAFSLSHFDSEAHRLIKSTPEYTLLYKTPVASSCLQLSSAYYAYFDDVTKASDVVRTVEQFGCTVATFLLYGKATSHASPHIDTAENLVNALEELSKGATDILEGTRKKDLKEKDLKTFQILLEKCCDLVLRCEDSSPSVEDMASVLDREMEAMNSAISEAVERFSTLLAESRAKDTGTTLEVNEGILATCSELMSAVRLLVQRASELQNEVVAAGKGGASPGEFYKRNHRWTEGLISGAKTVAIACQALVKAADDVVVGKGKFEEVIVASREIAASSMQVVMASRVKAAKDSPKMANLSAAAKAISTLTGTVVATAENCRDKVTEATTLDFSKLSLTAAKRLEMETLVKVLETEKRLETERKRLAELRRHHYQLGGELEGWDQADIPK